ncbi:MAG: DNA integrity scanning protein DisA nucleotide-binding domain protein [Phycisphaerales bacterium]
MDHAESRVLSHHLLESASALVRMTDAAALLVDVSALPPLHALPNDTILVRRAGSDEELVERLQGSATAVISVPNADLDRMGQIRLAAIIALSERILSLDDTAVFLVGPLGQAADSLSVLRLNSDLELFDASDQPGIGEHIKRAVFHRVLTLALEIGQFGREGKSVGAMFIVGSHRKVLEHADQLILNPFKGYAESERSILDDRMAETLREYSSLDGAFIIRGTGIVETAGTHLKAGVAAGLPAGLGARHAAAAGITAVTRSIAVTVSESGGVVRVWRAGRMVASFEPGTT